MIRSQFEVDDIDIVCLVGALMVANELEERLPEGEISRIAMSELGEFYPATKIALKLLTELHREEPDDWDGVVWYELFVDASRDSLADLLVEMLIDQEATRENIRPVVIKWLKAMEI